MVQQGFFKRLGNVIRGKAHSTLDSIESAKDALDNEIRDLNNTYEDIVRKSAPYRGSIVSKENEIKKIEKEITAYDLAISKAKANEDMDAAVKLLMERKELRSKCDIKIEELKTTREKTEILEKQIRELEEKIEYTKKQKNELLSRIAAADAEASINEIMGDFKIGHSSIIDEIERKVIEKEDTARGLASMSVKKDEGHKKYLNNTSELNGDSIPNDILAELENY